MEAAIVFISMCAVIFGISYLYFNTRHKERMALIEKDKDISIFIGPKVKRSYSIWKVIILNLGLLLIGIGLGVLIGGVLYQTTGLSEETAYPASIFMMSGVGLVIGYFQTERIGKNDKGTEIM